MKEEFEGRHMVVTGATGELGAVVAARLLALGATLHLPVRRPDGVRALAGRAPDRVHVIAGIDLGDEGAVAGFYAGLPPLWGSIHCAGGFAMSPIADTTLADFNKMLTINATSCFLTCREAVKKIRPGEGRIVNVASVAALEPRRGAGMIPYTVSKAAVAAATMALSEELAQERIWVNAVVPSTMDTEANRKAMPDADHSKWPTLEEVASTVLFLASPSNQVTRGALVPVYGRT